MSSKIDKIVKTRGYYISLSASGLVLSFILVWKQYSGLSLPFCSADSCDIVLNSRWSKFLGIPLSLWGCLLYAALLVSYTRAFKRSKKYRASLVTMGFLVSLYLLAVSVFKLGAICYYCSVSLLIIGVLFFSDFFLDGVGPLRSRIVGVVLAGLTIFLMQSSSTEGGVFRSKADPTLVALAQHLEQSGSNFYGASWCDHCQTQKEIFGSAAYYLPYVECSPRGPKSPQNTECLLKEIKNYPTWVINGRRFERFLSIEMLMKISGFQDEASENEMR